VQPSDRYQSALPGVQSLHGPLCSRGRERGVILIWAVVTILMIAGIVLATTDENRSMDVLADFKFAANGQAEEVAQAGLIDGMAWFRRQVLQPVAKFEPRGLPPSLRGEDTLPLEKDLPPGLQGKGLGKTPPGLDGKLPPGQTKKVEVPPGQAKKLPVTSDLQAELDAAAYYSVTRRETETPEYGLVRSYELAPGIWARYTVTRGRPSEPFTDANGNGRYDLGESYTDSNADGLWTAGRDTADVSSKRGLGTSGAIWYLSSRGEVFRRPLRSQPLGYGPNVRLAVSTWGTEIRRLTMSPPASAALCVREGRNVYLGTRVRVRGDTGVAYGTGTGSADTSAAQVEGTVTSLPQYRDGHMDVFGVDWAELKSMADLSTSDPVDGLPSLLPDDKLIVAIGDVTFDASRPLRGSSALVIRGNVTIADGSNTFFSGVLYVDGNLTIRGPALIRGSVIVTGSVNATGSMGDVVEIEHDASVVGDLLLRVGQYRHSKAAFRLRSRATPD